MDAVAMVAAWLVLAQADVSPPEGAGANSNQAGAVVPAAGSAQAPQRPAAAQLLADELALPDDFPLRGSSLSLLAAVSRGGDAAGRERIVQAYWSLSAGIVQYHARRDELLQTQQFLQTLSPDKPDKISAARALSEAALGAADAELQEAHLAVARAQERLAELSGQGAGGGFIPSDLPHGGGYNTQVERLAARRTLPARAYLLHRVLPVRKQAIDARVEAVYAALDAYHAALDAFDRGESPAETVLARIAALREQRLAFIAAVREYNFDIASYVLTVSAGASPQALVPMLIKPQGAAPAPADGFAPETARPLLPGRERSALVEPRTLRGAVESGGEGDVIPAGGIRPVLPIGDRKAGKSTDAAEESRSTEQPKERAAEKPVSGDDAAKAKDVPDDARWWTLADILDRPPAEQDKLLIERLYAMDGFDQDSPVTLEECSRLPATKRAEAVAAFWRAAESDARHQFLAAHERRLAGLVAVTLGFRGRVGGAEEMLDLQAARHAVAAEALDARAEMLVARYQLTRQLDRPASAAWCRPATRPSAESPSAESPSAESPDGKSTAGADEDPSLSVLHRAVTSRAGSVLTGDLAAYQAVLDYRTQSGSLRTVLAASQQSSGNALSLFSTLARYNVALAAAGLSSR
ncbi:MAG: hypothetical protein HYS13_21960 [Planctomycetia bacterium]|nr:hypothetical protein [Planctomycetia bacterium]